MALLNCNMAILVASTSVMFEKGQDGRCRERRGLDSCLGEVLFDSAADIFMVLWFWRDGQVVSTVEERADIYFISSGG